MINTTPPPGFSTQPSPNPTQPESSQLPSPYVRTPRRTIRSNPLMEQMQNQMQLVANITVIFFVLANDFQYLK
jgi:hypothetical protein